MRCWIKILLLITFALLAITTYANGDPVVKWSSVNRVANPEPLSIFEIEIVREEIKIVHIDGYNCFDVTYEFKNKSDKGFPEIHYGFPIDYVAANKYTLSLDFYSESLYEVGWNDNLIKDISFTFNGELLPFHSSKESVREAGYIVETYSNTSDSIPVGPIDRRWSYTKLSIKPHASATLNIRYKVYANSFTGLYSDEYDFSYFARKDGKETINMPFICRFFSNNFKILYDFSPAKHFGTKRGYPIDIDIDLSNLNNPQIAIDEEYIYYANRIQRHIFCYSADKIQPINMTIQFQVDNTEENIKRIISKHSLSECAYEVSTVNNTVNISLHNPAFITDISFNTDINSVKSINSVVTYSDGREKQYKYEPSELIREQADTRLKSPVILTMTDLNHNGIVSTEKLIYIIPQEDIHKNDTFKIKHIQLTFNYDEAVNQITDIKQSMCKDVKLIDARFIK